MRLEKDFSINIGKPLSLFPERNQNRSLPIHDQHVLCSAAELAAGFVEGSVHTRMMSPVKSLLPPLLFAYTHLVKCCFCDLFNQVLTL